MVLYLRMSAWFSGGEGRGGVGVCGLHVENGSCKYNLAPTIQQYVSK